MNKKIIALVLAVLMMFAFVACGTNKAPTESADEASVSNGEASTPAEDASEPTDEVVADGDLAYVKEKGKLVVGITEFAPMDYKDPNGEGWIGFDADMAKKFAEYLGVEVELSLIDWDNKVLELDGKNIDCVWNGMTLIPEVLEAMSCSKAYCNNAQIVIVPADKAEQYQTAEDCKDLKFAVESGSAGEKAANENDFATIPVLDQATALQEVAAGTADAAIIDSLMAGAMVGEGTGFENLTYTVELTTEEYGVGFRKGSNLVDAFNDFFAAAIADGTAEEIAEIYGVQAALVK